MDFICRYCLCEGETKIYGAILDGRIAWREAQRQHAVCGLLCGGRGGRRPVVGFFVVAASHEDASAPPATLGFIVVEGSQTIVGRPIREERAPEERGEVFYSQTDQKYHKYFDCQQKYYSTLH